MSRARRQTVAAVLAVAVLGLGLTACTGNDNGGVIETPPPGPTTTVVSGATTTAPAVTLPGGTLPSS